MSAKAGDNPLNVLKVKMKQLKAENDKLKDDLKEKSAQLEFSQRTIDTHCQEIQSLTRKISMLEEVIMNSEGGYTHAAEKLEEVNKLSKAADEIERERKVLESRNVADDEKQHMKEAKYIVGDEDDEQIDALEQELKEAKYIAKEADRKIDEVKESQKSTLNCFSSCCKK
ncbi:tropomyosin-like [Mytilus trossulus]|uniref:tropomyosin-like n=1 Tax=Mytilus trossulus TaxID=6551 RepID=UPI003007BD1E